MESSPTKPSATSNGGKGKAESIPLRQVKNTAYASLSREASTVVSQLSEVEFAMEQGKMHRSLSRSRRDTDLKELQEKLQREAAEKRVARLAQRMGELPLSANSTDSHSPRISSSLSASSTADDSPTHTLPAVTNESSDHNLIESALPKPSSKRTQSLEPPGDSKPITKKAPESTESTAVLDETKPSSVALPEQIKDPGVAGAVTGPELNRSSAVPNEGNPNTAFQERTDAPDASPGDQKTLHPVKKDLHAKLPIKRSLSVRTPSPAVIAGTLGTPVSRTRSRSISSNSRSSPVAPKPEPTVLNTETLYRVIGGKRYTVLLMPTANKTWIRANDSHILIIPSANPKNSPAPEKSVSPVSIVVWHGPRSAKFKRVKAMEFAHLIRDLELSSTAKINEVQDDRDAFNHFWKHLQVPDIEALSKILAHLPDSSTEVDSVSLFNVSDNGLVENTHEPLLSSPRLPNAALESGKSFVVVVHLNEQIHKPLAWVWIGLNSATLVDALQAQVESAFQTETPVRVVYEGNETASFKEHFGQLGRSNSFTGGMSGVSRSGSVVFDKKVGSPGSPLDPSKIDFNAGGTMMALGATSTVGSSQAPETLLPSTIAAQPEIQKSPSSSINVRSEMKKSPSSSIGAPPEMMKNPSSSIDAQPEMKKSLSFKAQPETQDKQTMVQKSSPPSLTVAHESVYVISDNAASVTLVSPANGEFHSQSIYLVSNSQNTVIKWVGADCRADLVSKPLPPAAKDIVNNYKLIEAFQFHEPPEFTFLFTWVVYRFGTHPEMEAYIPEGRIELYYPIGSRKLEQIPMNKNSLWFSPSCSEYVLRVGSATYTTFKTSSDEFPDTFGPVTILNELDFLKTILRVTNDKSEPAISSRRLIRNTQVPKLMIVRNTTSLALKEVPNPTWQDCHDDIICVFDLLNGQTLVWVGSLVTSTTFMESAVQLAKAYKGKDPTNKVVFITNAKTAPNYLRILLPGSTSFDAFRTQHQPPLDDVQTPEEFLGSGRALTFTLEQLQKRKDLPPSIDTTSLEKYLSVENFATCFKMPLSAFSALPKWKQQDLKKKLGLF